MKGKKRLAATGKYDTLPGDKEFLAEMTLSGYLPLRRKKKILAYIALTKPRIIELLLTCTIPTMIFSAHGWPGAYWWDGGLLILVTVVGGALSAGGSHAFNSYLERDIDGKMERTANRPLVTGVISARGALIFSWLLCGGSVVLFFAFTNPLAAVLDLVAILIYVVLYTLVLKRRTSQNIVWGGAAGCMPVLIAWAVTTRQLSWGAFVLFMIVFFWTPAHYWPLSLRYSGDYRRADVPMLGAVKEYRSVAKSVIRYAWATVLCSLLLVPVAKAGVVYLTVAVIAGAWFLRQVYAMRRSVSKDAGTTGTTGEAEAAMKAFHSSILYLALLFVSMAADPFAYIPIA